MNLQEVKAHSKDSYPLSSRLHLDSTSCNLTKTVKWKDTVTEFLAEEKKRLEERDIRIENAIKIQQLEKSGYYPADCGEEFEWQEWGYISGQVLI